MLTAACILAFLPPGGSVALGQVLVLGLKVNNIARPGPEEREIQLLACRAADRSAAWSRANGYFVASGQRRRASGRSSDPRGERCFGRRSGLCGECCFGRRSGLPRAALTALLSFWISSPHSSTDRSGL